MFRIFIHIYVFTFHKALLKWQSCMHTVVADNSASCFWVDIFVDTYSFRIAIFFYEKFKFLSTKYTFLFFQNNVNSA